jgi:hypothetical protein
MITLLRSNIQRSESDSVAAGASASETHYSNSLLLPLEVNEQTNIAPCWLAFSSFPIAAVYNNFIVDPEALPVYIHLSCLVG